MIPLLLPDMPLSGEILPLLQEIDANRWYTNFGPLNARLESALLDELGGDPRPLATSVANCTVGLELALEAAGLRRGARVLVPAITFVATGTAVLRVGMVPLIGDVDQSSWLLTPEIARETLRTAAFDAVLPVASFGLGQDVDVWDAFTRETGIPVIIDAAGAFGNQRIGRTTSVVFSLHATKSLGAGEGGLVVSHSSALIDWIRAAINFGIDRNSPSGGIAFAGTNGKLSEYHAAVGLASIARWRASIASRTVLFRYYRQALEREYGTRVQFQHGADGIIHTILAVRFAGLRDPQRVVTAMASRGVACRRWYCPPLHQQAGFRDQPMGPDLRTAEQIGVEIIGLPFYPGLREDEVNAVVTALEESLAGA